MQRLPSAAVCAESVEPRALEQQVCSIDSMLVILDQQLPRELRKSFSCSRPCLA